MVCTSKILLLISERVLIQAYERVGSGSTVVLPDAFPYERVGEWEGEIWVQSCVTRPFSSHERVGSGSQLCHQTLFLLRGWEEWEGGRVGGWESGRVGEWEGGKSGRVGRVGGWEGGRVGSWSRVMSPDALPLERVGLGTRLQARLVCNQQPATTFLQKPPCSHNMLGGQISQDS